MEQVQQFLTDNGGRFVDELFQFLRIQSVSADSAFQPQMRQAAEFVRDQFARIGLETEIIETAGHPIVYASWTKAEGLPTVLIYGHYDVQPPDPLDQWVTPPFEPTIRNGCVYARGATDDKGQLFTHIKSVEAWLETTGRLPINVKFVFEGEEEVGSENLDQFLTDNTERVACDIAVISDTSQYAPDMPAITYGLRGGIFGEFTVSGPNQDLHSGIYGGAIANPANEAARLVSQLIDANGKILIPGFYDDVVALTDEERHQFASLPFDETKFLSNIGMDSAWGDSDFSTTERRWARPSVDINGIISGYTGEGPKSIIPAKATVKWSSRLVPDQDPDKIVEALKTLLQDNLAAGLTLDVTVWGTGAGIVCNTNSPYMNAARSAIESAFGVAPVMIREGGSIPVVATFRDVLSVDTLLLGWGQNTDNLHSPNEHFRLQDFHRGTHASACLWNEIAEFVS